VIVLVIYDIKVRRFTVIKDFSVKYAGDGFPFFDVAGHCSDGSQFQAIHNTVCSEEVALKRLFLAVYQGSKIDAY